MRAGDTESEYQKRQSMSWQTRALAYIKLVPELSFASRFYARMLKPILLFPALMDELGQTTPIKTGLPVDLLDRIQDPGGGRSQILGNFGRLMFTTGEGCLFGRDLGTPEERWNFLWKEEVEIELDPAGGVKKYTHVPGSQGQKKKEYGPDEAVVYPMWSPSPGRSGEAESPMQAVLEIAEELLILTKAVRATATTRLTNGVLLMPSEISPPPAEAIGDEDPLNDPWIADLVETFAAQIENPDAAEARMPPIIWGANELIASIRHLPLHDPQTDYMEIGLRKEAIDRLALGLDMPPEALKGLGSTNHWAAAQILGDMWKSHGASVAEQFCDDLNSAYLRPALREAGYENWNKVVIDYDASQVVVKPDRSDDADKAYDRGMISNEGYRQLTSIPKDYAPSEDEHDEWLAIKMRNPALLNGGAPIADIPPPPGPEGDSGRVTRVVATAAREMGAIEMALVRCRELAGMRIRQKEKICPECLEAANGVPAALVASAIGPDGLFQLGIQPRSLIKDGCGTLQRVLTGWGHPEPQVRILCEMIEVFAARTLLDDATPTLPSGILAQVERMKGAAEYSVSDSAA